MSHIVLCLDQSGSMAGQPWEDLRKAFKSFISTKRDLSMAALVSVVQFGSDAVITLKLASLSEALDFNLYHNGGGTRFEPALSAAKNLFRACPENSSNPTLVFMSDGANSDGDCTGILRNMKQEFPALQVHTVFFGKSESLRLRSMAEAAGGKYHHDVDGIALRETFTEIARCDNGRPINFPLRNRHRDRRRDGWVEPGKLSCSDTLLACMMDVSESMQEVMDADDLDESSVDRASSLFAIIHEIASNEANKDVYLAVQAFGTQPVQTCDLIGLMKIVPFTGVETEGDFDQDTTQVPALKILRPRYPLPVDQWITVGIPALMQITGRFYHEVKIGMGLSEPQFGWATNNFQEGPADSNGVGDDVESWGADGIRFKLWHGGPQHDAHWPQKWKEGDVIGLAIDIDAGVMQFSLNGEWVDGLLNKFEAAGRNVYPAISTRGQFEVLVPSNAWQNTPPSKDYKGWADSGTFVRPIREDVQLVYLPRKIGRNEVLAKLSSTFRVTGRESRFKGLSYRRTKDFADKILGPCAAYGSMVVAVGEDEKWIATEIPKALIHKERLSLLRDWLHDAGAKAIHQLIPDIDSEQINQIKQLPALLELADADTSLLDLLLSELPRSESENYTQIISQQTVAEWLMVLLERSGAPALRTYISAWQLHQITHLLGAFIAFRDDPELLRRFVPTLPKEVRTRSNFVMNFFQGQAAGAYNTVSGDIDKQIEACVKEAASLLEPFWRNKLEKLLDQSKIRCAMMQLVEKPQAYPIHTVLKLLDMQACQKAQMKERTTQLLKSIKENIYGGTPMCAALSDMGHILRTAPCGRKLLFIVSDGDSRDGDPSVEVENLKKKPHDVMVLSCFLTSQPISNPLKLYPPGCDPPDLDPAAKVMRDICSSVSTENPQMQILAKQGWELPPDGEECSLFLQTNSSKAMKEFARLFTGLLVKKELHEALPDRVSQPIKDLLKEEEEVAT